MSNDPNFTIDDLFDLFGNESGSKKPLDVMHEETSKEIARLEKRLAQEYKQAERELKRKTKEYLDRFKDQDKRKRALVKAGILPEDEYKEWRRRRIGEGKLYQQKVDEMTEYLSNVNRQATDIINHKLGGVYAGNYNYARYEIEKGFGIDTSFALFDERAVSRLAKNNPKLLPTKHLDKAKDKLWSKRKINNAIIQGIIQGESLDKIAGRMSKVAQMSWNSARTNARTAMTGAQNAGRVDSYKDAKKIGINVQKEWMATLDERTRTSHRDLDGEKVPNDKKFSNGLMYPADPEGRAEEIYNCRCTLVADLLDYPDDKFQRWDNINGVPIDNVTYNEWAAARGIGKKAQTAKPKVFSEAFNSLKNYAQKSGVDFIKPTTLKENMSSAKAWHKLGGGDRTKGSCSSVALAYIGNKAGLDVYDFRGGASQRMFSSMLNIQKLAKLPNVKATMVSDYNDFKIAKQLLEKMEDGKEYYFTAGKHAAIIRKNVSRYEYLEMQSERNNGWHELNESALKRRFGCQKSHTSYGHKLKSSDIIIDIESLQDSDDFKELLGYINTSIDKQQRGRGGHER